jgi:sporulation inhibitor KapD
MREIVSGRILAIDEEERIIVLLVKHKLRQFYLQRSMFNKIGKYFEESRFIQFVVTEEPRLYRNNKVSNVDHVLKVMEIRHRQNIVYYDLKNIKKGTKNVINSLRVKMFLDLEMSMHPYSVDKSFKQEIIQVGYVLVDSNNNLMEEYIEMIKPTIHPKITRRTIKFLKITQEEVDKGIDYIEFYNHFKEVIEKYNPAIIVWGRNDFLALRESYKYNKVPSLKKKTRYINLLKLHKNYFNLKNDLGLFNALNLYTVREDKQAHNALDDAQVTREIFNGFKKAINYNFHPDLSKYQ